MGLGAQDVSCRIRGLVLASHTSDQAATARRRVSNGQFVLLTVNNSCWLQLSVIGAAVGAAAAAVPVVVELLGSAVVCVRPSPLKKSP